MDFRRQGYEGKTARYIGPPRAMTWGDKVLEVGDLVPDPTGLLPVKAGVLWMEYADPEPVADRRKKRGE